ALRLSTCAASDRLGAAETICARLPGTLRAWTAGAIEALKARAIADAAEALPAADVQRLEDRVLPRAVRQTIGQLRASLARAVAVIDPDGVEERHTRGVQDRRVELTPGSDGMAQSWALLPADAATRLYQTLTTHARASAGDGRTTDQRRADALTDLAELADRVTGSGSTTPSPLVRVTVPASTLLGLDNAPGELDGYGPIPASMARRIAADATWRRLLTDATSGALLDLAPHTYRPSAALADFIRTRDRTCRFPGCRQPAAAADIDHTIPHPSGGTTQANLATLCRRHHLLKHETRWQLTNHGDGTLTWTTPTGHTYRTEPERWAQAAPDPDPAGDDPPPF
ncbi:MAG: DUF222 domain-containing protein, partial [Mycobacteriales bacterium]